MAGIIGVKGSELTIFGGAGDSVEIGVIADGLEVTAEEKSVDLDRLFSFDAKERRVDRV